MQSDANCLEQREGQKQPMRLQVGALVAEGSEGPAQSPLDNEPEEDDAGLGYDETATASVRTPDAAPSNSQASGVPPAQCSWAFTPDLSSLLAWEILAGSWRQCAHDAHLFVWTCSHRELSTRHAWCAHGLCPRLRCARLNVDHSSENPSTRYQACSGLHCWASPRKALLCFHLEVPTLVHPYHCRDGEMSTGQAPLLVHAPAYRTSLDKLAHVLAGLTQPKGGLGHP